MYVLNLLSCSVLPLANNTIRLTLQVYDKSSKSVQYTNCNCQVVLIDKNETNYFTLHEIYKHYKNYDNNKNNYALL